MGLQSEVAADVNDGARAVHFDGSVWGQHNLQPADLEADRDPELNERDRRLTADAIEAAAEANRARQHSWRKGDQRARLRGVDGRGVDLKSPLEGGTCSEGADTDVETVGDPESAEDFEIDGQGPQRDARFFRRAADQRGDFPGARGNRFRAAQTSP